MGEPTKVHAVAHLTRQRRYHLTTFGCQMNVHDSERMAGLLERAR